MRVMSTSLPDVLLIEPRIFRDERGFFMESWQRAKFQEAGIEHDFVQDNHSRSIRGTLRGLHYQVAPHAQGKLVRVTAGEVFDVAVDIRPDSQSFGRWVGEYISEENNRILWIPPGFAHGFYVTSEYADVEYKCTAYYAPESERAIRWDDPVLSIDWPLEAAPRLSHKDLSAKPFSQVELVD